MYQTSKIRNALIAVSMTTAMLFVTAAAATAAPDDARLATPIPNAYAVRGINNRGEIAGSRPGGVAVLWDKDLNERDLPGLPGSLANEAAAINDGGVAAGTSRADCIFAGRPTKCPHAVVWDAGGALTDLGVLPGASSSVSFASGLNDDGVIVGESSAPARATHAVKWTPTDAGYVITDLGTLPDSGRSRGFGINQAGRVVGEATTADGVTHAVTWDAAGKIAELPNFAGSTFGSAAAVNNAGVIAGTANTADGQPRAVVWTLGGDGGYSIIDLGVVPGGNGTARGTAINERGQVTGRAGTPSDFDHAVIWTPHGQGSYTITDLAPFSGDVYSDGWAINNRGSVVGRSIGRSGFHAARWDGK